MEESVHDWIVRNYCDEQDELFFNGEKKPFWTQLSRFLLCLLHSFHADLECKKAEGNVNQ